MAALIGGGVGVVLAVLDKQSEGFPMSRLDYGWVVLAQRCSDCDLHMAL